MLPTTRARAARVRAIRNRVIGGWAIRDRAIRGRAGAVRAPLWLTAALALAATLTLAATPALGGTPTAPALDPWVPNGAINVIARAGGKTYIGGNFTQVAPRTGSGVAISTASGAYDPQLPEVSGGVVSVVVADGSGGWYIGGTFTHVDNQPRGAIAHILPDKSLDPAWNPNANGPVRALAVSGSKIYVGGEFATIGGAGRNRIAELCLTASCDGLGTAAGNATAWNPDADNTVYALAISGARVYAAGSFANIGGAPRNNIAELDAGGNSTGWNPNASSSVRALVILGTTVYAAGDFATIGGAGRNRIAALCLQADCDGLGTAAGSATGWDPNAGDRVRALAVSGNRIYAGGDFLTIGGAGRNRIAELCLTANCDGLGTAAGNATAWDPNAGAQVFALAVSGSTVYAAGFFTQIGGQPRRFAAALDATTGQASAWDPRVSGGIRCLALAGSTLFAGGDFFSVGGVDRNRLAALDASGQPTSWNPDADGVVNALAVSGSSVYAGGTFAAVGGQARNRIAQLDASTGQATSWNPDANAGVNALAISGTSVYAGGTFTSIGGAPRNNIAKLDSAGNATAWDPNADGLVGTLAVSGSTVYAGGLFANIGGAGRTFLAALDADTGTATPWAPNPDAVVRTLALSGSTLYVGGNFGTIAGQPRGRLAAFDGGGALTGWDPGADSGINALAVSGSTVVVGGAFGQLGGQPRRRIGAVEAQTGSLTSWDPSASATVRALVATDANVYSGGDFITVGTYPVVGFAEFIAAPESASPPTVSGTPQVGAALSCSPGSWLNEPSSYAYRWQRDGADVPGATSAGYVLTSDDAGHSITCVVTASNIGGSGTRASAAAAVPATGAPTPDAPSAPVESPCGGALDAPLVSVSHWKALGSTRVRLRAMPGSYVERDGYGMARVDVRGTGGQAPRHVERVEFSIDGEAVRKDSKAPFRLPLDGDALDSGFHRLQAVVHAAGGRTHTLAVDLYVDGCDSERAALSVSLSSKLAGTHPDVEIWARSASRPLRSATFTLPSSLNVRTRGIAGRIGTVEVISGSRTRSRALRISRRATAAMHLTRSSKVKARLATSGRKPTLSVSGVGAYAATGVRLQLSGKSRRLVRMPARCDRLEFAAELAYEDGATESVSRGLRMCKRSAG